MAIWVIKYGQREGPYEERDVRELLYEGTYNDNDPAIRDGQLDWTTLGLLLGRTGPIVEATPPPLPPTLPEAGAETAPPAAHVPEAEPPLPLPAAARGFEAEAADSPAPEATSIRIVDFDISFRSLFLLFLKAGLAVVLVVICIVCLVGPALALLGALLSR